MSKLDVRLSYLLLLVVAASLWGLSTTVFAQQQDVLTLGILSTLNQPERATMTSVQQGAPFPVYISFTASAAQAEQILMQTGSQDGALPASLTMPALAAGETWSELLAGYGRGIGSADYRYCYGDGGNQICSSTITVTYSAPAAPVVDIDTISSQWRYVVSNSVASNGCSRTEEITRSAILSQDGNDYSGMFPDFGSTYTGVVDGSSYILGNRIEDFSVFGGTYVEVGESRYANNELRGSSQWWWTDTRGFLCWGSHDVVNTALRDGDDHSDTTVTATVVALDTSVSGEINPSNDEDYFRIEITTPTSIAIFTTGDLDTEGDLFDSRGDELQEDDNSGEGENFLIRARLEIGTYYLEVENDFGSTGAYTLHVMDENDDHGDTRAAATVVALDTSVSSTIDHFGDVDYFRIEITTPTDIVIYTTGNSDTAGDLYDSSGIRLVGAGGGYLNFQIYVRLDAGVYYIRVTYYFASGTGPYILHVETVADDHGDTTDTATVVALDTSMSSTIDYFGDVDYFRIEITTPTDIVIYTTGNSDTVGDLYDSSGSQLAHNDDHFNKNFQIYARLDAGTYYLAVNSTFGRIGAYMLHVDTVADDHNGTTDTATVVALDTSVSSTIDYFGDADYFSIEITTPTDIVIYTTGNSDTVGDLYDSSGNQLAHNDDYFGRNFQIYVRLDAGVYYIRVTYYFASGTGPYILHVETVADNHGDTTDTATVVALDTSVTGTIDYPDDVDYFSIEITAPISIALFTTGEVNTEAGLFDNRGIELQGDDTSGEGENLLIRARLEIGTYYLKVQTDGDTGPYILHVIVELPMFLLSTTEVTVVEGESTEVEVLSAVLASAVNVEVIGEGVTADVTAVRASTVLRITIEDDDQYTGARTAMIILSAVGYAETEVYVTVLENEAAPLPELSLATTRITVTEGEIVEIMVLSAVTAREVVVGMVAGVTSEIGKRGEDNVLLIGVTNNDDYTDSRIVELLVEAAGYAPTLVFATVIDDDSRALRVEPSELRLVSGSNEETTVSVSVNLSSPSETNLDVRIETEPSGIITIDGSVVIESGSTESEVAMTASVAVADEMDVTVTFMAIDTNGNEFESAELTATVLPPLVLSAEPMSLSLREGDAAQSVMITASAVAGEAVAVTIELPEGVERSGNEDLMLSQDNLSVTLELMAADDEIYRGNRTVTVMMNAAEYAGAELTVMLEEDESEPVDTLMLSTTEVMVTEGGSTEVMVLSEVMAEAVTVEVTGAGVTADVIAMGGSTVLRITIADDDEYTDERTAVVELLTASYASERVYVTVLEDDYLTMNDGIAILFGNYVVNLTR